MQISGGLSLPSTVGALTLLTLTTALLAACATPRATAPTPTPVATSVGPAATAPSLPTAAPSATAPDSPSPSFQTPAASPTTSPVPTGPTAAASPSTVPGNPTPAARTRATPTTTTSGDDGILEGQAFVGPLTPVERVGVPTPTPSPSVCTARGLAIFAANATTPVTSFSLAPDCTYRVTLSPGQYVVRLRPGVFGFSKDLPKTVTIQRGQTTRLDVHIDTGIR